MIIPIRWIALLLVCCAACRSEHPRVDFFVAASAVNVAAAWQADCGQASRFAYHSGASIVLARQIEAGAEASLFLPAGTSALAPLAGIGRDLRVDSGFLVNEIVLVCAPGVEPPGRLEDLRLPRFERIALADPNLAPAGVYTREGLGRAGLWSDLESKLIRAADVRVTLEAVRQGAADAGFVYATDALSLPDVAVVELGPESPFPAARYPLVMFEPAAAGAESLWSYLHSEPAHTIARRFGFR